MKKRFEFKSVYERLSDFNPDRENNGAEFNIPLVRITMQRSVFRPIERKDI